MKPITQTLVIIVCTTGITFASSRIGYQRGYDAADEESWKKNCAVRDEFYVCNDLRGFSEEAVSVATAMKSAIKVVEFDSIGHITKAYQGQDYTIMMISVTIKFGIRRDTKESVLLLVGPVSGKDRSDKVIASVSVAGLVEKTTAALKEKCLGEDNCDVSGARIDALHPDAVVLAQKAKEHIEKNFKTE